VLADPQSVTINAVAKSLKRTGSGIDTGQFRTVDGIYSLNLSHAYAKRTRRTARLDYKVIAADVMDSSLNVPYSASVYLVADVPNVGITRADQGNLAIGFCDWLSASGYANLGKLLDGES
jgi:hypothetical protein